MSVSLYGEAPVSPSSPDVLDTSAPGVALAVTLAASVAGTYTHVGWWGPLTNPPGTTTYSGRIWTPTQADDAGGTGTAVAFSETTDPSVPGAWNWIELLTGGYHAAANEIVRASWHQKPDAGGGNPTSIVRYTATSHGFDAAKTSGVLRAPAAGEPLLAGTLFQGTFRYDTREFYPKDQFNNGEYFIDVRFVPDSTAFDNTDSATLTDAGLVLVDVSTVDSAALSDSALLAAAVSATDDATLTDAAAVGASAGVVDSATLTDASALVAGQAGVDVFTLTESSVVQAAINAADAGTLTDLGILFTGGTFVPVMGGSVVVMTLGGFASLA